VPKFTRRSFLQQTPISAATLSLLPAAPSLAAIRQSPELAAPRWSATSNDSMVIHVNDVATGEITLLVGAQEIVLRDPGLVAYLIEAAR